MKNEEKECSCRITGTPCKDCTCQKQQTIRNDCMIDWTGFTEKSLKRCNDSIGESEDSLVGFLPFQVKDRRCIMDIHYEYSNSREKGFCLEIYASDEMNRHCRWLGTIRSIKSAVDYQRFCTRVKNALTDFMEKEESKKNAGKAAS